jgi:hypothetical protein
MKDIHIIYIVLAVMCILLIAIAIDGKQTEGFTNAPNECPRMPAKGSVIYKKNGKKSCCYSKVDGHRCENSSESECMLGTASNGIPECGEFVTKTKDALRTVCPKSMQNIFFTDSMMGCTDGPLNADESGPMNTSSKQCVLPIKYDANGRPQPDEDDIHTNPNNCLNVSRLDTMECIGVACDKFIRKVSDNKNVMIGMDFSTGDGMRYSCFDDKSYRQMLESANMPADKINSILSTNPMVCSVAKRLYVDKTMGAGDARFMH